MTIANKVREAENESLEGKNLHPRIVPESTIRNPRVRLVIDFMSANLQRKISLTELTEVANLSASHLSRLFNAQTGLSPGEYLRRLRMEKAAHLLATSVLSIKQIMALAGYNNKSHFGRDFRRSFDLTPSEYRRRISTS